MRGEKVDGDKLTSKKWIQNSLPEILWYYEMDDIYNTGETGLYFTAIP